MSMYGCIGMKYITEICNTEDPCSKQQLTGITWSVATKSQCRKWVFYIHFLLHFTLSPQMRELRQIVYVTFSPTQLQKEHEQQCWKEKWRLPKSFWRLPFALLSWSGSAVGSSCSPGSAQTLPPGEPEIKPHRRSLFSSPKKEYFCRYFIGPPSAWHCLLCKWCRENNTAEKRSNEQSTHYGNACQQ